MSRLLFIPFSIAGGLAAGFAGKKLFGAAWALIGAWPGEERPDEA